MDTLQQIESGIDQSRGSDETVILETAPRDWPTAYAILHELCGHLVTYGPKWHLFEGWDNGRWSVELKAVK